MDNYILKAMNCAKKISKLSDCTRHKLGAVIFRRNKILVAACNMCKSNPLQGSYNKYRATDECDEYCLNGSHAEINAIRELCKKDPTIDMSKLSILIYRELHDGTFAMARPCKSCEAALKEFGIKDIYYTAEGKIVHEEYLDL